MNNSKRRLAWAAPVVVLFTCAACTSMTATTQVDPFLPPTDTDPAQPVQIALGERPEPPGVHRITRVAERRPVPAVTPPSVIRQVAYESPENSPTGSAIATTSTHQDHVTPAQFTPAEPRDHACRVCPPPGHIGPAGDGSLVVPGHIAVEHPLTASPDLYPDEYLLDGGDRDHPVHYDAFNRLGLDTEDTVAEYLDERGRRFTKPTNRVAVYAPRFAAVRSLDTPGLEAIVRGPGSSNSRVGGHAVNTRLVLNTHLQNEGGIAMRTRSRVSGLDSDVKRASIDQTTRAAVHDKLVNLGENIRFLQTGIFEQEARPLISKAMQNAVAWNGDVQPVAHVKLDGVHEVTVKFMPQQLIGKDESARKPANLRIVKLADKDDAQRGEIVTFTIRYDNLGDDPVHYLTIVDNLTPRLEYVEDSADSDRVGQLVVQENGEGSLVLVFEVDEPIEGGEGGVVSFQTRVR